MSTDRSAKVRAQVIADLQAGEQPAVVAEKYGIPASKVRTWKTRYVADDVAPVAAPVVQIRPTIERQQREIGTLVLDLLRTKLEASQAIAQAVSNNPAWIASQSGSELAALGEWLDATAFAIGDRLAQRPSGDSDRQADA